MRGLIAVLYIFALGWAFSHYELDKLVREAARKGFRSLVAEGLSVSAELSYTQRTIDLTGIGSPPAAPQPRQWLLVPVVLPGGSHG